jgi:hypothetical protein
MNDQTLTLYLALTFAAIVIAILAALLFAYLRSPQEALEIVRIMYRDHSGVQMAAVIGIVLVVFVLGMQGKLDSEVVSTILSGIAGYVLGDSSKLARVKKDVSDARPPVEIDPN